MFDLRSADDEAMIRLRLAPSDARYAGGLVPGSKAMEIFADLETELALREGGDEGLCAAYESVQFTAPLRVGDFVEGVARVVSSGRRSRRIEARIYKVLGVDEHGARIDLPEPVLAATAVATVVVGTLETVSA
ncbi:hotdog fold domain-containing protein [Streptomyces parvulus]|uniref:3-aminobutyryl-CoA ammonia lyase n=1 Tax=Streptomyces parvulus TaxID=146923 RepID=A0A369UZ61_9ACTN|nr:hotdog fold domain-containing protein [Streptomyces parvulus]RDD85295.1 3-aminobutyryl-CoA ammonia lyase [Streptomyces parvulus]